MARRPPLPTPLLPQIPTQPHPTPPLPHHPHPRPQLPLPILPPPPLPQTPHPHPPPPLPSSPHPIGAACAALGPNILLIGGSINDVPSSAVHVFDSTANRWGTAPRMRFGREFAAAGVVDGRVYVLGGCVVDNWTKSRHWAEVFDPKVGAWAPVPPSPLDFQEKWMHGSAVLGGRIYAVADRGGVVFDPNEGSWGHVSKRMDLGWRGRAAVVDGVLYCYDYLGKIRGFVEEEEGEGECVWKQVRGLDKGLPKFMCGATMANVGGNLCVLWEGKGLANQVEISCALIDICRDSFGELRGSILSSQVILVVPRGSSIVHCLDVAL
ncbi:hypothetical protein Sjap_010525 [Stephania japonica]|uniref:FKB95-like N-terminal Kelch domain-containing protein n=1 Tax=Stephania japonica TaxID=461633 RepID=A0AAP0JBR8_9MAGN